MVKGIRFLAVLVVAACVVAAQTPTVSAAYVVTGDSVRLYNDITSDTNGGPFTLKIEGGGEFPTFCIEMNEYFTPGTLYYATVETAAIFGGVGGGVGDPPSDPLGLDTAFLYKSYVLGNLSGVISDGTNSFTWTGSTGDLSAVQDAIWYLEEELSSLTSGSKADILVGWVALQDTSTATDVRVANIWKNAATAYSTEGKRQSMLTLVPEPTSSIIWLCVAGVFGSGYYLRRRKE